MARYLFLITTTCRPRRGSYFAPPPQTKRVIVTASTPEGAKMALATRLRDVRRSKGRKGQCTTTITGPRRTKGGVEGVAGTRRGR